MWSLPRLTCYTGYIMKKSTLFILSLFATIFSAYRVDAQCATRTVIAGNAGMIYSGDGGPATDASLNFPTGVCTDSAGDVFICDADNYRIRKVNHSTGIITTIAGNGTSGCSGDGYPAPLAQINTDMLQFTGIAADANGNCYFADQNGTRIRRIDYTSGIITTIAGGGIASPGDGGPATAASLDNIHGICLDATGNIVFAAGNRIRKVTAATGIIVTIAGNNTSGFGGDGGLATAAILYTPYGVAYDPFGNLYIADGYNYRIRKINTSGIITTVAGTGNSGYAGNGGPATAALLNTVQGIGCDSVGNVYFVDNNNVVRCINVSTGLINKVAGSYSDYSGAYADGCTNSVYPIGGQIFVDRHANIFCTRDYDYVEQISGLTSVINTLTISDSVAAACTLPAPVMVGFRATTSYSPAATDSVTVTVNYKQFASSSTRTYRIPYWYTSGYGFGSNFSNIGPFNYTIPGIYTPTINITTIGGYNEQFDAPAVQVGDICTSNVSGISFTVTDSITSQPCVFPAAVRFIVSGTVSVIGAPASNDSIHLIYRPDDNDTFIIHRKVPIYAAGGGYAFHDSISIPYNSGYYFPTILAVSSSGAHATTVSADNLHIDDCSSSSIAGNSWGPSGLQCSLPFTGSWHVGGTMSGYADTCSWVHTYINYGDGTDTTVINPVVTDGHGNFTFGSSYSGTTFNHTYSLPGTYDIVAYDTANVYSDLIGTGIITLANSCSPLSGTLYIDADASCTLDPGEVLLAYWPYALVNNTTGDTTYGWCDDSARYSVIVIDGDSYTFIADPDGYFGWYGAGSATLSVSCPASGAYSFVAVSGSSYVQDFGFSCTPPTAVDMNVSGWGWGFVPGDTGIVSVWSSNYIGYLCTSLSDTITLVLDPLLTYAGMWSGPAPTTVSGSILTWVNTTSGSLLDFTANVKVITATTATMGSNVCNNVYTSATSIPDPYMANNTYSWCEPVTSSWDPNEKEVSPKGSGPQGYIPNGTSLSYMIHFQNTGTAPAHNILVCDTISNYLDIASLTVVSSCSPVLVFQEGNVIKFKFNDIFLPDSVDNPEGSIGYIAFNINPLPDLAPGTQIKNMAGIYFDYNSAVLTNTTLNTINPVGIISGPTTVCIGSNITLTDSSAGGTWTASNSHVSVTGGIVTGISEGTTTISYTVPGAPPMTIDISVVTAPAAGTITGSDTVCVGGNITLSNTISGGTWSVSNTNASISFGTVTGNIPGVDTVYYTTANTCGTAIARSVIYIIPMSSSCGTSVESVRTGGPAYAIYPNPATSELVIVTGENLFNSYTISNSLGQVLTRHDISGTNTIADVSQLPAGVYYITLRGAGGTAVQKFVKM